MFLKKFSKKFCSNRNFCVSDRNFCQNWGPSYPKLFRPTSELSNETRFVFLSRLDQKLRCKTETPPIWWMIAVQYLIALGELSSLNWGLNWISAEKIKSIHLPGRFCLQKMADNLASCAWIPAQLARLSAGGHYWKTQHQVGGSIFFSLQISNWDLNWNPNLINWNHPIWISIYNQVQLRF